MTPEAIVFEDPNLLRLLWGLPFLLLLVLLKRKAAAVVVPWLPVWEKAIGESTRAPTPLRWIVSLLVKALLIAAAVAAWAHPMKERGARLQVSTLIVVDRSAGLSSKHATGTLADATAAAAEGATARARTDGPVRTIAWSPDGRGPAGATFGADVPRDVAWVARTASVDPEMRTLLVTPFLPTEDPPKGVHVVASVPGPLAEVGGIRSVVPVVGGWRVRTDGPARTLALFDGDRRIVSVAVATNGETTVSVDGTPLARPRLVLEPPDAWPDDDTAFLDGVIPSALKVLVVARGPTPALDAALAASGRVAAEGSGRVSPDALPVSLDPWDLTCFVGGRVPDALPPGDYAAFSADLPAWAGRMGPPAPDSARSVSPAFGGRDAFDPREWTSEVSRGWTPPDGADARVVGGRGVMFGKVTDRGRRLHVFSVPPTADGGSLVRLAAFPVMIRGVLAEVPRLGVRSDALTRRVGAPAGAPGDPRPVLSDADGRPVDLRQGADGEWLLPGTPGHYRLDGRMVGVSVLDAPGRPVALPARSSPWPDPPPTSERTSLRWVCLLVMLALLFLDACLGELWPPR